MFYMHNLSINPVEIYPYFLAYIYHIEELIYDDLILLMHYFYMVILLQIHYNYYYKSLFVLYLVYLDFRMLFLLFVLNILNLLNYHMLYLGFLIYNLDFSIYYNLPHFHIYILLF